eukprot:scaffold1094_cov322-Prasinococcus_capsulatus_cf.AAC.11
MASPSTSCRPQWSPRPPSVRLRVRACARAQRHCAALRPGPARGRHHLPRRLGRLLPQRPQGSRAANRRPGSATLRRVRHGVALALAQGVGDSRGAPLMVLLLGCWGRCAGAHAAGAHVRRGRLRARAVRRARGAHRGGARRVVPGPQRRCQQQHRQQRWGRQLPAARAQRQVGAREAGCGRLHGAVVQGAALPRGRRARVGLPAARPRAGLRRGRHGTNRRASERRQLAPPACLWRQVQSHRALAAAPSPVCLSVPLIAVRCCCCACLHSQDTVGCGDSFAAAVALGYRRGYGLRDTAVLANAVGACTATRSGAGRAVASRQQVEALLRRELDLRGEARSSSNNNSNGDGDGGSSAAHASPGTHSMAAIRIALSMLSDASTT